MHRIKINTVACPSMAAAAGYALLTSSNWGHVARTTMVRVGMRGHVPAFSVASIHAPAQKHG
ncbi:hypothetical protein SCLCIDRAFT_1118607 [Scleroderma citrinum Foug A]|uniref:Uncharacterized protein n=1 Tax=Scleroderma citrinum Foug A TaxID=1036808 RepID=A0A0C2Z777_9AGAM|nr:hypothetical protein SCLCIDRAFT_1118607 [Scleroderma citrinum Foug A]